jgi:hypothetical protein
LADFLRRANFGSWCWRDDDLGHDHQIEAPPWLHGIALFGHLVSLLIGFDAHR